MTANPKIRRVPTRFDRQTRFKLEPKYESLAGNMTQSTFEQLKARLINPVLSETSDPGLRHQLRLAANEAAAVAWTTAFPLLVLPVLMEEKAAEVQRYASREPVQEAAPVLMV
jgi:hypothetical protein